MNAARELERFAYPQLWEKLCEYLEIQRQRQALIESYGDAYPAETAWFRVKKCCGFFTWDSGLPPGPALLKCEAHPSAPLVSGRFEAVALLLSRKWKCAALFARLSADAQGHRGG